MKIDESVVLITGAATRVGRLVARHLAERGASIAFSYYLREEPWQEAKAEFEAYGRPSFALQVEVRDQAQVMNLIQGTVQTLGGVDVLINSASVWLKSPLLEISETDWDLAMDVNVKGPFMCSQAAASFMLQKRAGVIINITDLSAFQVWEGYAHHAASKAALVSLTKYMAKELAPTIRVNAIAPGTVMLPDGASDAKREWAVSKSVLGRIGSPEDVARLVEFLIENDFITGSVYFVDGGRALT
jgi:NAD(P)-dependent dehydrogenase (short-subunit alcohol dehydrogenase family)